MVCLPLSLVPSRPALQPSQSSPWTPCTQAQVHHWVTWDLQDRVHTTHTPTGARAGAPHTHVYLHTDLSPQRRGDSSCWPPNLAQGSSPDTYFTFPNPRHLGSRTNRVEQCLPPLISKVPHHPVPAAPTDRQALPPFFLANSKSVFKVLESNASPESL